MCQISEMKGEMSVQNDISRIRYALHSLYSSALADDWVWLPNTGSLFAGRTPLEYMVEGGSPAVLAVRQLLEARMVGN